MSRISSKVVALSIRHRTNVGEETGFTLVETVVAVLLLAIGSLAVLQVFDASTRNAFRAEESQIMVNRIQQEIEEIRNLDYDEIALTSAPTPSTDPGDPRNRVTGTQFTVNRDGTDDAPMVINGAPGVSDGAVDPGPETFQSGDVAGQVHRFVVWRDDPNCLLVCPGQQDYKQVIVAVRLDETPVSTERPYQEVQTDVVDPEAGATSDILPPGGGTLTAQQFFLSDTTCNQSSRQAISGDHPLHNTLGVCADGLRTGSTAGAPDALFTAAPPDPDPADATNPPSYDYATNDGVSNPPDLEPDPNTDRGLQLIRPTGNGCQYNPTGTDRHAQVHRWVTAPMPLAFVMSGQATLELWTRTINDVNVPGELCVWLFTRAEVVPPIGPPIVTDTPVANLASPPDAFFSYSDSTWPRDGWEKVRLQMSFPPTTALLGQRVGVALSLERDGAPVNALQFHYDHPDYPSRLEVQTATPLP